MVGQKQYDKAEFIGKAMKVFWSKGYDGTSMNDLVKETGVNRGSIYTDFAGKKDIFLEVLSSYDDIYRERFLARLAARFAPGEAIIAAFEAAACGAEAEGDPEGCLMVNTAVEVSPHDGDVLSMTTESFRGLQGFFERMLVAARGDDSSPDDLSDRARAMMALFLGLRVLVRAGADSATREAIVRQARDMLR